MMRAVVMDRRSHSARGPIRTMITLMALMIVAMVSVLMAGLFVSAINIRIVLIIIFIVLIRIVLSVVTISDGYKMKRVFLIRCKNVKKLTDASGTIGKARGPSCVHGDPRFILLTKIHKSNFLPIPVPCNPNLLEPFELAEDLRQFVIFDRLRDVAHVKTNHISILIQKN